MATRQMISCEQRFSIFERDGFRCVYCGRAAKDGQYLSVAFHADHVYPRSRGGADVDDNLVTACSDCNIGKAEYVIERLPPGLPDSVIEHFFSYLEDDCGLDEPASLRVPAIDRHLISMLLYIPGSAGAITRLTKQYDCVELATYTREIISTADSLICDGHEIGVESLAGRLSCKEAIDVLSLIHSEDLEWLADDYREQHSELLASLEDLLKRRAAEASAFAAAERLRHGRISVEEESRLLELMVMERWRIHGVKEITDGR